MEAGSTGKKGIQDTHRRSSKVVTTMFSVHDSRVGKPFCTNSRTWFASVSEYREIKLSTSMELRRDSVDDAPVPSLDCIQLPPAKKTHIHIAQFLLLIQWGQSTHNHNYTTITPRSWMTPAVWWSCSRNPTKQKALDKNRNGIVAQKL